MTVYIEEEYGYRYWKAEVDMTENALAAWWATLTEVTDSNIHTLFPNVVNISENKFRKSGVVWAHIHCNDDSYLYLSNGNTVYHLGYEDEIYSDKVVGEVE